MAPWYLPLADLLEMSHFNLNNGLARRRYIGPTHGLKSSVGEASLENLGGRIIIESEMYCHRQRMKTVRPSIDSTLPWAHAHQESLRRGGRPASRGASAARAGEGTRALPPFDARGRPPSAGHRNRTSSEAATPSRLGSRPVSQSTTPSKAGRAGPLPPPGAATSTFDVTSLPPSQQDVYKGLVQLLATLPQRDAKGLLEQAFKEGEERKLLMAYTGVFPDSSEPKPASARKANVSDEYEDVGNVDRNPPTPKSRGTPQEEASPTRDRSDSESSEPQSP